MRNIFVLTTILIFIFSSCTEEQTIVQESNSFVEREVINEFIVFSPDKTASMHVKIYNEKYKDSEHLFQITPNYDKVELQTNFSSSNKVLSEDDADSDFLISEINVPKNAVGLNILIRNHELIERGRSDLNIDFNGREDECGSGGIRIRGFQGFPLNCAHTDWEWKKKTSTWNLSWQTLYDADSYNSSTFIGWLDPLADFPVWRLRIDPNDNCNEYSTFSILVSEC